MNDARLRDTLPDRYQNFDSMLETAEELAKDEWETKFVEGLKEKYSAFGDNMFFSPRQRVILERILER